jgi:hypothetical protein
MHRMVAVSRWTSSVLEQVTAPRWWRRYGREARRPLMAFLFLLPIVILYECVALAASDAAAQHLTTRSMLQGLLSWFGLVGAWVPGVAFLVTMLVWMRMQHERWRLRPAVLPTMAGESLLLALPLLTFAGLFAPAMASSAMPLGLALVQGLGAGVYEELVFRFLLISGLTVLVVRASPLQRPEAAWVAGGLAALLFSMCHFQPIAAEPFTWGAFWFRLVAGGYLAVVYLTRGLGLAAGSHAAYNVLLLWWSGPPAA